MNLDDLSSNMHTLDWRTSTFKMLAVQFPVSESSWPISINAWSEVLLLNFNFTNGFNQFRIVAARNAKKYYNKRKAGDGTEPGETDGEKPSKKPKTPGSKAKAKAKAKAGAR